MYILITTFLLSLYNLNAIGINNNNIENQNPSLIKKNNCECLRIDSTVLYIENKDTIEIKSKYLISIELQYSTNSNLDSLVKNANVPYLKKEIYCYSKPFKLKGENYLIQIISNSGYTNQYIVGNSKTNKIHIYYVTWSDGFPDRTSIKDFKSLIKGKSTKKQLEYLNSRLTLIAHWNQKRFPVFAK